MLVTIGVGLIGALLMFAGDMLLYYTPKDFSYSAKSSSEEKINAIIDVMKRLPAKRVMAGGMIGPVAAFLYCVGFYHIVLMTNAQSRALAISPCGTSSGNGSWERSAWRSLPPLFPGSCA